MFDPRTEAKKYEQTIIEWRRALHRVPEVGTDLPQTTALIRGALEEMGYAVETYSNNGMRAVLKGAKDGPVIAFRADMDALPVREETGLPFASRNGCMHACGHDAHAAMLLGAARVLMDHREDLAGSVIFLFQPAEETTGGAKTMIEEGCLKDPDATRFISMHTGNLFKDVPSGCIGWRKGPLFAGAMPFYVTVKGRGGHAGRPHEAVDPIPIACEMIQSLQRFVSRELPPVHGNVVTVGMIHGGTIVNVIPDEVKFGGSIRTLHEEDAAKLRARIPAILKGIAEADGAEADVEYIELYPPTVNDPESAEFLADCARSVLGEENVVEIEEPTMGSEDVAFYLREVPGSYAILSSHKAAADGVCYPHHSPRFDIDESVLHLGTAVFCRCAQEHCKG